MNARLASTALLVIGLGALSFGQAAAPNDERTSDDTIVINITGNGYGAKYLQDGESTEKPVLVKVGQTVKWVNKGNLEHSATSFMQDKSSKPVFDTGVFAHAESKAIKFDSNLFRNAGGVAGGQVELPYFCTRHPATMKNGKIILSDAGKK